MRNIFIFGFIMALLAGYAQDATPPPAATKATREKKRGNFYLTWGYTRCMYSKSTIHFEDHSNHVHPYNNNVANNHVSYYDFTIYDAKATDRPDFDKIRDVVNITIPQFVVHGGYYFKKHPDMGIEINYDHAKYVVDDYQRLHIKGEFNGTYVDKDTTMNPNNFLHFEHTDGANFVMVNFVKKFTLYKPVPRFNASWVAKAGGGVVYPRTDVTIFGEELNNHWHVAGWIVGVETGLRLEFLRRGVFEFVSKGSFADYRHCLVLGVGNGNARHTFYCGQLTAVLGVMF